MISPSHFLLVVLAGWINEQQQSVIDYLKEENRILREQIGGKRIRFTPQNPNLNAYAERFVRSIKEECLDRLVLFGEHPLRHVIREYVEHYHTERNHQGLNNRLIQAHTSISDWCGTIEQSKRLGGMLNFYYRKAA